MYHIPIAYSHGDVNYERFDLIWFVGPSKRPANIASSVSDMRTYKNSDVTGSSVEKRSCKGQFICILLFKINLNIQDYVKCLRFFL